MAEKYMPFDYDSTVSDPTVYEYTATDERTFNMSNFTNGVFPQTKLVESGNIVTTSYLGGSLAVTAGVGLSVDVSAGIAMVEGVKYWNSEAKNIAFEQNNIEQIYDIVVELDTLNQRVLTKKKARTSGIEITADLIRTNSIYQLAIATVIIPANAAEITSIMITDQRLNTNLCTDGKPVCGLVGAVSQIDFSVLYNQIMDWFNNLKENLSSDAAVNLQTQVDALKGSFTHLLSGTVHALTGTFPVSSGICTIKFKATAGYTSGDTFTVNGTAYTAAMQGGESLDTNAFVTGDVVQIGVDMDAHKLVFKGGGGAKLNIFAQTATPTAQDGLWIKSDDVTKVDIAELVQSGDSRTTKTATLSNPSYGTSCGVVGNICYIFGGNGSIFYNTIQAYDPSTNIRTTKTATLSNGMYSTSCGVVGNICYIFGGYNNSIGFYNAIQAYDPSTDTRTTKTATLANSIRETSCGVVGNICYIFNGLGTSSTYYNTIQAYDPSTNIRTTKTATLANSLNNTSCGVVGNICYIFGGYNGGVYFNKIQAYDPSTDTITTKTATLVSAMSGTSCGVVGNICYIFGGYNSSSNINTIQAYDPSMDTRTTKTATLANGMQNTSCGVVENVCYIFGGSGSGYYDTIQAYNPIGDDYPQGTAVVELSEATPYKTTLMSNSKFLLQPRIKRVLLSQAAGLLPVNSAVINRGTITNIL